MAVRYIGRTSDLWLRVQIEGGAIVSVPYGLKVDFIENKGGRDRFTILEGVNKGKLANVSSPPGHSYLITTVSHRAGAVLSFDNKTQALKFSGSATAVNAFSGGGHRGFTPVAPGTYELAIPAFPSAQTRAAYSAWTRYHNLWFRIGTDVRGSRFLHPGAISDGCVTVRQFVYDPASGSPPPKGFDDLVGGAKSEPGLLGLPLPAKRAATVGWDKIVDVLLLSRLNDQAVGKLTVT